MGDLSAVTGYYNAAVRILMPLLAVGLLLLCGRMLLRRRRKPRPLAAFVLEDGTRLPVTAEETAIGRSTVSDICLPVQSVSRRHAVLTRDKTGWRLRDTRSKGGVTVNGEPIRVPTYLEYGDRVAFAGVGMRFVKATAQDAQTADGGKKEPSAIPGLFVLTIFQLLGCLSLLLHYADKLPLALPVCFAGLLLMEWIYCGVRRFQGVGVELLAFFLVTIGLFVAASAVPSSLYKQFAAVLLGLAMFCVLSLILRDVELTMKLRYVIGALAVGLLVLNLFIGETRGGAKKLD